MAAERISPGRGDAGSMRMFYALWPDEQIRTALAAMQASLSGRAVDPRNLHLTLAFLGQQPNENLPLLQKILLDLPKGKFDLLLDRSGYFPRNRIAWVGAGITPRALSELYESLVRELDRAAIRFMPSARFKPHITLAREAAAGPQAGFNPIRWQVRTIALVQSVTGFGPAQYRVLSSGALAESRE